jgi:hypothetical protein
VNVALMDKRINISYRIVFVRGWVRISGEPNLPNFVVLYFSVEFVGKYLDSIVTDYIQIPSIHYSLIILIIKTVMVLDYEIIVIKTRERKLLCFLFPI